MNLPAKDPAESLIVEFDFSSELSGIDSALVAVSVIGGTDPDAAQVLSGALQIAGAKVFQRVSAGIDRVNYKLTCTATRGSDVRKLAASLPVRAI